MSIKPIVRAFICALFMLWYVLPVASADLRAKGPVNFDTDCVFGCDPCWEVHTRLKIERNRLGYRPVAGDRIAWEVKTFDRLTYTRFNGIWYYSQIMPTFDVAIRINGVEQSLVDPSCYKALCTIDLVDPVHLSSGDTIQIEVTSVADDGYIHSLQPSVGQ